MENVLLMPFLDESESFTNGFECGQIWQQISEGNKLLKYLIHSSNEAQIRMICQSFGIECHIEEAGFGWSYLNTFDIDLS